MEQLNSVFYYWVFCFLHFFPLLSISHQSHWMMAATANAHTFPPEDFQVNNLLPFVCVFSWVNSACRRCCLKKDCETCRSSSINTRASWKVNSFRAGEQTLFSLQESCWCMIAINILAAESKRGIIMHVSERKKGRKKDMLRATTSCSKNGCVNNIFLNQANTFKISWLFLKIRENKDLLI